MARRESHQLPRLPLGIKLLASAALLLGWALFFSAWLASVVASGWGMTLSGFIHLGALVDSLRETNLRYYAALFALHGLSLPLIIGITGRLVRKVALPRGFRKALLGGALALAGLDLLAWALLPYSAAARTLLAPLLALESLVLLVLVALPAREMWSYARWRGGEKKRVVVVGGGFAGLYAALELDARLGYHEDLEIVLLDKKNYFLFPPLLPSVATGAIETRQVTTPFRKIFEATNIRYKKRMVDRIDLGERVVHAQVAAPPDPITGEVSTRPEALPYDYLVFAPGSATNTFGVPGADQHAFFMRELGDAVAVRNHMIDCFEQAAGEEDPALRRELLRFVVVGAGPTGVELAAEAQDLIHKVLSHRYPEIDGDEVEVWLVQSGGQVLPGWHALMAERTATQLGNIQVRLKLEARVVEVGPCWVGFKGGERLSCRTVVWCAGVKPAPLVSACDFPQVRGGRIQVDQDLRVAGREEVFVLGDIAHYVEPGGERALPALAQVALQQGAQTGNNLVRLLKGQATRDFKYLNYGALLCVGEHYAVVDLMGLRFSGFVAWFVWRTLYLAKLVGFGNKVRVVMDWTLDLLVERSISQIRTGRTGE